MYVADVLSFGTGAITNLPAVYMFCLYTSISVAVTFLYQLTFFTAAFVLFARLEESGRHALFFTRTVCPVEIGA
jgi:hypothetical protein